MASGPITSWQRDGETVETVRDFISWAPKSLQMLTAAMKWKMLVPWKKSYDQLGQHIKKQGHYFANKVPSSQSYGFSSSHIWMWELDHKESWAPKNWCFWTVVLEKTLDCPLDCKEIQPVHLKGNQSWIFIGRTDAEAETPITLATGCKVSEVTQSCPTLCDLWTVAHQAPRSMGFSRQEYCSGLPFPSPGDLPDPRIEPRSPTLQADTLTFAPPGKPLRTY